LELAAGLLQDPRIIATDLPLSRITSEKLEKAREDARELLPPVFMEENEESPVVAVLIGGPTRDCILTSDDVVKAVKQIGVSF